MALQKSYTQNYIKIYFWQGISLLLGFASMFVVIPFLSSNQSLYGIYSVCTSVTIFFSYADLGFLSAGQKYAAEAYARQDRQQEIAVIGFSHFIFFCLAGLLGILFLYLSTHPSLLIHDLSGGESTKVAHDLLLILALVAPVVGLQRMLQMIFSIRLQEYKLQRIIILGNILKLLSAFVFFYEDKYNIVGYFLCSQIITLTVVVAGFILAKKCYSYDFYALFSTLRFDRKIFQLTKNLAFSTIFVTLSWVLYYELDPFVIGRFLGANQVAIYAIGLTILTFFRSIYSIIFAPFISRFNHFIGQKDLAGLRNFYKNVLYLTFPIVVFPIIAVEILLHPIVLNWVGPAYLDSISIARWLVLCNLFAFVSYPAGIMLTALKKLKSLYIINTLTPLVYWIGILSTIRYWGLESFGIFKFVAFLLSCILYFVFSLRMMRISIGKYLYSHILPFLPSIAILFLTLGGFQAGWMDEKSKLYLFYDGLLVLGGVLLAFSSCYLTVPPIRLQINHAIHSILRRPNCV